MEAPVDQMPGPEALGLRRRSHRAGPAIGPGWAMAMRRSSVRLSLLLLSFAAISCIDPGDSGSAGRESGENGVERFVVDAEKASRRPHVLLTTEQLKALAGRDEQISRLREIVGTTEPRNADERLLAVINRGLARHLFNEPDYADQVDALIARGQEELAQWREKPFETLDDITLAAVLTAMAYGFDLCFSDFSAERRSEIADDLAFWGEKVADALVSGRAGVVFGNHSYINLQTVSVTGSALLPDPRGLHLSSSAMHYLTREVAPALDIVGGEDGGWSEGVSYNRMAALAMVMLADALTNVGRRDAWRVTPWLEKNGDFILYHLLPNDRFLAIGDVTTDLPTAGERLILGRLAAVFQNPYYADMAISLPSRSGYLDSPLFAGLDLVYVDPEAPRRPVAELPPSRHFAGIGLTIMREDWGPDSAVVSFRSGPSLSGHMHADQNSFTVFRTAPLAIDSGMYDGYMTEHRHNYYRRAIAHNTIVMVDPAESFSAPIAYRKKFNEDKLVNDGGPAWYGLSPATLEEYSANQEIINSARTEAFHQGGGWQYVRGEAGGAYSASKVGRFTRELLLLHRRPDGQLSRLLVMDRLALESSALEPRWLLHTVEKPQILPGRILVRSGAAVMAVAVLAPAASSTLAGGPGREFVVGGRNYAPLPSPHSSPPPGAWRLEVTPDRPAREQAFVVMLVVGPGAEQQAQSSRLDRQNGAAVIRSTIEGRSDFIVLGREDGPFDVSLSGLAAPKGDLRLSVTDVSSGLTRLVTVEPGDDGEPRLALRGRGPHLILEDARP